MVLIRRLLVMALSALALSFLVGCAVEVKRTDGYKRPATSASVRLYVPSNLPILIGRMVSSSSPQVISDDDRDVAQKEVSAMLKSIESQLNTRLTEVVNRSGLKAGDDLVIAVDVERATHWPGRPGGTFNVRALYRNQPPGSAVWSANIRFSEDGKPEAVAAEFVELVMHEIQSNRLIGSSVN